MGGNSDCDDFVVIDKSSNDAKELDDLSSKKQQEELDVLSSKKQQEELDEEFYKTKNIEVMEQLLKKGANINTKCKLGVECRIVGNNHVIKFLVDQPGIDLEMRSDRYDYTPIMETQWLSQIKILKEAGANINAIDNRGNSVIMTHYYDKDIVKYLVSCGADLSIKNKNGHTIYDIVKCRSWIMLPHEIILYDIKKLNNDDIFKITENTINMLNNEQKIKLIKSVLDGC